MAFDPITAVTEVVGKVLDRVLPDKAANDAAKAQLLQMQVAGEIASVTGQLDIDKVEAASSSTFVAGWRPFIGWICGLALAVDFIIRPFFMWGCALAHYPAEFPTLDMSELYPLIFAMLGMGALHVTQDVMNKKTDANSSQSGTK